MKELRRFARHPVPEIDDDTNDEKEKYTTNA
jgi:hypothetical protein